MSKIIEHSFARPQPRIYFKDEPLSEPLTLPASLKIWPSLMTQLRAYKSHNRGTLLEAFRLAARYGGYIISDPFARHTYEEVLSGRIRYQAQAAPDFLSLYAAEHADANRRRVAAGLGETLEEFRAMLWYMGTKFVPGGCFSLLYQPSGWVEERPRLFGCVEVAR